MAASVTNWDVFFFSSRRRHTRYWRDWNSDVCSSDLKFGHDTSSPMVTFGMSWLKKLPRSVHCLRFLDLNTGGVGSPGIRSEERRGGKARRTRWLPLHLKKKKITHTHSLLSIAKQMST